VYEPARPGGCSAPDVIAFDQQHPQAVQRRLPGYATPVDPPSDHHKVEGLAQRFEVTRAAQTRLCQPDSHLLPPLPEDVIPLPAYTPSHRARDIYPAVGPHATLSPVDIS